MSLPLFISWSGPRSRKVAEGLRDWLPRVLQVVEPWVSEHDIEPGVAWLGELNGALARHELGLLCVTRENLTRPWLMFEAGALWRGTGSRVIPYVVDGHSDLKNLNNPLFQLEHVLADEAGTWKLIDILTKDLRARALLPRSASETVLRLLFRQAWPDLRTLLASVPPSDPVEPVDLPSNGPAGLQPVVESLLQLSAQVGALTRRVDELMERQNRAGMPPPGTSTPGSTAYGSGDAVGGGEESP